MRLRSLLLALLTAALMAPAAADAADYVPDEVIVKYRDGTTRDVRADIQRQTGTAIEQRLPAGSRELAIRDGQTVSRTLRELRSDPNVLYAVPNYIARASAFYPNDPGFKRQWNFRGTFGIRMPDAWSIARRRRAPGGRRAVVAVVDTGVAYRRTRRLRRVPDLNRFTRGYDFINNDRTPDDLNGHGTHVAGTIAQSTNNRRGAAGIAYRASIMPIRVLDRDGEGTTSDIARAIRFAASRRADVINMSLEFDRSVRAGHIPDVIAALRYARRKGTTVVAAAGNQGDPAVAYPAKAPGVIAVAATTDRGCQAEYSNTGPEVDIAAPGGGEDSALSDNAWDAAHCNPSAGERFIYQQTYTSSVRRFGLPGGYEGTSMSAPHVAGVVALLRASRRIGRRPSPAAVEAWIKSRARDLGPRGPDIRYGAGLLDAAAVLR